MPESEHQPKHPHDGQGHHHKDDPPPAPADKPQEDKTAGDLRAEDAVADTGQLQAEKQGIQDAADDKALQQYASEQVKQYPPPASDPLKDREARIAGEKKHHEP